MTALNLTANGKPQELILAYLQENASETLAEKINNGTPFTKDGIRLVNKKTLDGFMQYADSRVLETIEQAQRKGEVVRCLEDSVVYGWAIHYFEEDSIEGKLFNEDGTEYKPPKPVVKPVQKPIAKAEPPKPKQQQASLWDMLAAADEKSVTVQPNDHEVTELAGESGNEDDIPEQAYDDEPVEHAEDDPSIDEIADALEQAVAEKNAKPVPTQREKYPPFYVQFTELTECYPDSIILVRLGDFYEAFDNDAETLSEELGLTITSRKLTEDLRVPMVGFPYHASDAYIAKIRAKHDVVIAEFNGDIVPLKRTVTADGRTIDRDTGEVLGEDIEELTEMKMRQFDGDIQEPKEDTYAQEKATPYSPSTFHKQTMFYLYELLDEKIDIA